MRSVSDNYKNYIASSMVRKPKSKVVIDNTNYTGEEHLISFPKVEHHSEKATGSFPAATCEFEILNRDGTLSLYGKEVTVYRGLEINGTVEWVQIGIFSAKDEDIKVNINKRTISFKGTDKTQLFDKPYGGKAQWENGSKIVSDIVNEICTRLGVPLCNEAFPLSDYEFTDIPPGIDFDNITDRQIIAYIAELAGCIAVITSDGELKFKGETENTESIGNGKYKSLSVGSSLGPVNAVSFGHADYDDAVIKMQDGVTEETKIEWAINDNPLTTLTDETQKANLLNRVATNYFGRTFIPFELVDFIDDYLYELNDSVTIQKKDGTTFQAQILEMSTTSRIKSKFKASLQTPGKANTKLAGSVGGIRKEFEKVQLTVNHLENTIDLHAERLEGIEGAGYITASDFSQTAESIKATVTAAVTENFNAEISELENSITASLELYVEKDDNDRIVSMLNASADEINLNSDRLIINSTNFKLSKDGTVTATNAKLTDGVIKIGGENTPIFTKIEDGFVDQFIHDSYSDTDVLSGGIRTDVAMNGIYQSLFYNGDDDNNRGVEIACLTGELLEQVAVFNKETIGFMPKVMCFSGIETNSTLTNTFASVVHYRKISDYKAAKVVFGCGAYAGNPSIAFEMQGDILSPDINARLDIIEGIGDSSGKALIYLKGQRKGVDSQLLGLGVNGLWYGGVIITKGNWIESTEDVKTNISSAPSTLSLFSSENSAIYSYNYIKTPEPSEPAQSAEPSDGFSLDSSEVIDIEAENETCYGFVIGEGYSTPPEVLSEDGKHINLYSMASINWKATQELLEKITALENEVALLKAKEG